MMEVGIHSTGDDLLGIVLMSRLTSSSVGGGRSSSGRPVKGGWTCHPTERRIPPLPPAEAGTRFSDPGGKQG